MPRPLRPLQPDAGPVQAFAAELRELRRTAGDPKFLQMARRTGKSRTALAEAVGGDHLPTWETVVAFVTACNDEDPGRWRGRWEEVRAQVRSPSPAQRNSGPSTEPTTSAVSQTSTVSQWINRLSRRRTFAIAALAFVGSVLVTLLVGSASRLVAPVDEAVLKVQNMVAVGERELVEDVTPAYLSTRPEAYCAARGCQLEDSMLRTAAKVVASCTTEGEKMYNYNLDSAVSARNPNRAVSSRWYRVSLPDGRSGFLSEVYVDASSRGGLNLPLCSPRTYYANIY
jgi:hypothetical protein